eukprot:TRINITY_DN838_c0_g1_i1.p1 TRINITY_DN838_c0_g1~~TRINITY_DN838_c0_g1_i1.p1  ORF type:complete len:646 (-),score=86.95 TRINITY_DN838_c0_g1_i1:9-1946(-)
MWRNSAFPSRNGCLPDRLLILFIVFLPILDTTTVNNQPPICMLSNAALATETSTQHLVKSLYFTSRSDAVWADMIHRSKIKSLRPFHVGGNPKAIVVFDNGQRALFKWKVESHRNPTTANITATMEQWRPWLSEVMAVETDRLLNMSRVPPAMFYRIPADYLITQVDLERSRNVTDDLVDNMFTRMSGVLPRDILRARYQRYGIENAPGRWGILTPWIDGLCSRHWKPNDDSSSDGGKEQCRSCSNYIPTDEVMRCGDKEGGDRGGGGSSDDAEKCAYVLYPPHVALGVASEGATRVSTENEGGRAWMGEWSDMAIFDMVMCNDDRATFGQNVFASTPHAVWHGDDTHSGPTQDEDGGGVGDGDNGGRDGGDSDTEFRGDAGDDDDAATAVDVVGDDDDENNDEDGDCDNDGYRILFLDNDLGGVCTSRREWDTTGGAMSKSWPPQLRSVCLFRRETVDNMRPFFSTGSTPSPRNFRAELIAKMTLRVVIGSLCGGGPDDADVCRPADERGDVAVAFARVMSVTVDVIERDGEAGGGCDVIRGGGEDGTNDGCVHDTCGHGRDKGLPVSGDNRLGCGDRSSSDCGNGCRGCSGRSRAREGDNGLGWAAAHKPVGSGCGASVKSRIDAVWNRVVYCSGLYGEAVFV